jgi:hypothetical protein
MSTNKPDPEPGADALIRSLRDLYDRFMMASDRLSKKTGDVALDRERAGQCEAYFDCAHAVKAVLDRPAPEPDKP